MTNQNLDRIKMREATIINKLKVRKSRKQKAKHL